MPRATRWTSSLVTSNDNLRIDSGFENPYTDQYIVTFEHQLSDRVGFAVNGVWKKWDNQSAWRDIGGTYAPVTRTAEGKTFELLQLTSGAESRILQLSNHDPMEATYKGVHFQVNKRMSNRWQGTVGLTLSKAEGRLGTSTARVSPISMATAPRAISADRTRTTITNCRWVAHLGPAGPVQVAARLRARLGHDAGRELHVSIR